MKGSYEIPPSDRPKFSEEEIAKYGISKEDQETVYEEGDRSGQYLKGANTKIENPNEPPEEKILGKFNSQEDLEKAYLELQKKLSSGGKEEPEEQSLETEEDGLPDEETTEEQEIEVVDSNTAIQAASVEYFKTGEISEDTFKMLEEHGIPRELAQEYRSLYEAKEHQEFNNLMSSVGGEEGYQAMAKWAQKALEPEVIDSFNNVVENGTMNEVREAINDLKAQYDARSASLPNKVDDRTRKLIKASGISPSSADTYKSRAEIQTDMSDPRYANDPAFRAKVAEKIARSNV